MHEGLNRYEVYTTVGSKYCYPGTSVLKNRFHLQEADSLKKIETDVSALRQAALMAKPIKGHFTPHHLCAIHRYLFGDIYSFAGRYRKEDIMKGDTRFLRYSEIADKLKTLLAGLTRGNYLIGTTAEELAAGSAFYMAELNYIHPFREGNGRAIREFMRTLFLKNNYVIDWSTVSRDSFLPLMEQSVYQPQVLYQLIYPGLTRIVEE